ncbi:2-deoxy-D-gluconate 3-dehydrogenase [Bryobacterales bacterium F-183]|nr:2-deoxy-D-gluconate 3-dehydrogenase [Bryobacterales bacterium F-183]
MNPRPLEGKVAVITGASRGLGKAMAVALAEGGAKLALVARDAAKLEETKAAVEAAGSVAKVFLADVAKEADVLRIEKEITAEFGTVNILINNAGINLRKQVHEFTLEEWNSVMDTNVTSVFLMCRSFVPVMKGQGYGRIINMTSIMAHVSLAGRTAYSTSKTALLGFTRALALELAPEQITVVGISPGPFGTEMNTPLMNNPEVNAMFMSKIALGRWGRVEEIGKLALFLCSEDAGFITGTDILIDGGWCAQ